MLIMSLSLILYLCPRRQLCNVFTCSGHHISKKPDAEPPSCLPIYADVEENFLGHFDL